MEEEERKRETQNIYEEEGDFNGRRRFLRCERAGTNSALAHVWVRCVESESTLAGECVTNTAGQKAGALFLADSDRKQAERRARPLCAAPNR